MLGGIRIERWTLIDCLIAALLVTRPHSPAAPRDIFFRRHGVDVRASRARETERSERQTMRGVRLSRPRRVRARVLRRHRRESAVHGNRLDPAWKKCTDTREVSEITAKLAGGTGPLVYPAGFVYVSGAVRPGRGLERGVSPSGDGQRSWSFRVCTP